ncbi:von Willebrand factor type A domain-containing protein [Streptomyces sp. NPDC090025]|uniref:vWA domain-containing protein n=1 Tax=Streptomyces sp. NPDC090025 TaxID=3365922 RepID=UPI00383894E0
MRRRPERAAGAALAALLAGALLLTGCGAGADGGRTSADHASGKRPAPAPGQVAPDQDRPGQESPGSRDIAPAPRLSTFALDVDTASYGYARRTLAEGRLPDPADVRSEEFVNSFKPDYPRPKDNGFSVTLDGARSDAADWSLLRVGLATRPSEGERPPAALTFVVDVSGSMGEPGRLDLVKQSLRLLADELRDDDSVALVTFSDRAEVRLPMSRVGDSRGRIRDVVDGLATSSSTNVEAGVRTGYDTAVEGRRKGVTNRVVLLSDALANTGDTDADGILERIDTERRRYGITLFGVGVGSDYGDAFMERLADKGDGMTTYVATPAQARKVFVDQLPGHLELRARDAKAQVAFDPRTVADFKLIGYENRKVADEDFRDDRVDGGEIGAGHTVTALYAVQLKPGQRGKVATATVRWLDPATRAPHERSATVDTAALTAPIWGDGHDSLQLTAIAAYFADRLRGGHVPGAPPLSSLAGRAGTLAERARSASVRELAEAIRQADALGGGDDPYAS